MDLRGRATYALGTPGFLITSQIVVGIGIYFYLPPGDVADLEPVLSGTLILGVFTAYGLARLLGGIVDSLADPVVGHLCDRSRSPLGRRRSFMIYGILPMVALPALLFWPPGAPGSQANFVFLAVVLAVYFVFFTVYVAPYLALTPEIARTERERVALSQLVGLVSFPFLAFLAPAWAFAVDAGRDAGLSSAESIRIVVVALSVLALLLCLGPILAVDERKLPAVRSDLPMREAVSLTVRDRPFLLYLLAMVLFIIGMNMFQPITPYLAEVVLGRDLSFAGILGIVGLPSAAVGFVLAQRVVRRLGPKRTILAVVAIEGGLLLSLGLLQPDVPGGPMDAFNLALVIGTRVFGGFGLSAFLILPNVLIGQLIDRDQARTGMNRSAMFFGAQGLFTKWAFAAAATIVSFLFARFGNSQAEPTGVLLVAPAAGALCLLSAAVFAFYPERQVIGEAASLHAAERGALEEPDEAA